MVGGDDATAWRLFQYYNARCRPPWELTNPADARALRHKFDDCLVKARV